MPKVSIVMAAYNAEAHIADAVDSVLGQSFGDWELLITDDGSKDNTPKILAQFTDRRIRVFRQPNGGVSKARNLALRNAAGEFVTFLDSDDLLPPASLKHRLILENETSADILVGAVSRFSCSPPNEVSKWLPRAPEAPLRAYVRLDERVFHNIHFMIKRTGKMLPSFDPSMSHSEDLDFIIRYCVANDPSLAVTPDIVYQYRLGDGSAMSNLKGLERGYWQLYQKVRNLPQVAWLDKFYLRHRILRILVLSYLNAGMVADAAGVFLHFCFPERTAER